jgi:hypothetical protein
MTKKKSLNFAIVRSIFGDYWVGLTKLEADEKNIFSKREDAVNKAQDLYCSDHPDFDIHADTGDEQYDWDMYNFWSYIELDSFDCEEIPKKIEDKIVRR